MLPDAEGFLSPSVDVGICTGCDLCLKVCPVFEKDIDHNQYHTLLLDRFNQPIVYAAWHQNSAIRAESSSGGVFTALADDVLVRQGVVAGAAFDQGFKVRHITIQNKSDLSRLRGSKYVQSEMNDAFLLHIRNQLKQKQTILFSGTPCQVAGLRHFLQRTYDNLFCCDIICHGVPSPLLLAKYAQHVNAKGKQLASIGFRDKATGWKKFSVRQYFTKGGTKLQPMFADPYMAAFLRNYALRESCYQCQFTTTQRWGDLTIADFWQVAKVYPEYDQDDLGTSLVFVNTEKGRLWLKACRTNLFIGPADLDAAIAGNPQLKTPSRRPAQRDTFYRDLELLSFKRLIQKYRLRQIPMLRRTWGAFRRGIKNWVDR